MPKKKKGDDPAPATEQTKPAPRQLSPSTTPGVQRIGTGQYRNPAAESLDDALAHTEAFLDDTRSVAPRLDILKSALQHTLANQAVLMRHGGNAPTDDAAGLQERLAQAEQALENMTRGAEDSAERAAANAAEAERLRDQLEAVTAERDRLSQQLADSPAS